MIMSTENNETATQKRIREGVERYLEILRKHEEKLGIVRKKPMPSPTEFENFYNEFEDNITSVDDFNESN
jgi:hypothetical protein